MRDRRCALLVFASLIVAIYFLATASFHFFGGTAYNQGEIVALGGMSLERIRADKALEIILGDIERLPAEKIGLASALGRVLAEDIYAPFDLLPFDNSAMDGYAVRAVDTESASRENACVLQVVEDVAAGHIPRKSVGRGQAIRIMTGAPLPEGADAVVMVEATEAVGGAVRVYEKVVRGENVRPAGEDVVRGDLVIQRGKRLRPAEIGMLAALGRGEVSVFRRAKVAIIVSGEEILEPGAEIERGKIYDSNSYSLMAQALDCGAEVLWRKRCGDQAAEMERLFLEATEADVIISSGGVSVGVHDVVREVVERIGEVVFWRIAIKPGMPMLFGRAKGKPIFGLPGNPVSCMVTFELFVRPFLLGMMGQRALRRPEVTARSEDEYSSREGRREYVRAWTYFKNGQYRARITGPQGSARLSTMTQSNSLLIVPEDVTKLWAGDEVLVQLTDQPEIE